MQKPNDHPARPLIDVALEAKANEQRLRAENEYLRIALECLLTEAAWKAVGASIDSAMERYQATHAPTSGDPR